ncbi:MAG TPA: ankyrin repeat domain-containing protein, partial [Candidatus Binatus sp.]|nr:ankyrin repeat domain-containing protein [Candidatus Binatus sp.]
MLMNPADQIQTIIESVTKGDIGKIEQLFKTNPALADARNKEGISLLVLALYRGRTDIADLFAKSKRTPLDLTEASSIGNLQALQQILAKNPEAVNSFSSDGFTPLGLASYLGRKNIVEHLLSKGADVNTVSNNPTEFTALTGALAGGHVDITRLLLEKGANPN